MATKLAVRKCLEFTSVCQYVKSTFEKDKLTANLYYGHDMAVFFREKTNDYLIQFAHIDQIFDLYKKNSAHYNALLNNATVILYYNGNYQQKVQRYNETMATSAQLLEEGHEVVSEMLLEGSDKFIDQLEVLGEKELRLRRLACDIYETQKKFPLYFERGEPDYDIPEPQFDRITSMLHRTLCEDLYHSRKDCPNLSSKFSPDQAVNIYYGVYHHLQTHLEIGCSYKPQNQDLHSAICLIGKAFLNTTTLPFCLDPHLKGVIISRLLGQPKVDEKKDDDDSLVRL